jgi:hypothetical protein
MSCRLRACALSAKNAPARTADRSSVGAGRTMDIHLIEQDAIAQGRAIGPVNCGGTELNLCYLSQLTNHFAVEIP